MNRRDFIMGATATSVAALMVPVVKAGQDVPPLEINMLPPLVGPRTVRHSDGYPVFVRDLERGRIYTVELP